MPDFMIVLRGFDRRQVEMWAAEVANQIEQERRRADEAEKRAYRAQIESKGAPSFSHLGTHVASILEEAGRSSENMLADAAARAKETIEAAEEEAAQIVKAAEHRAGEIEAGAPQVVKAAEQRAGEIEADAHRILEEARSEGARVEEDALQAAEEMRAQAEQDARTVLEEARDATDMIWQEAERERLGVEAETIRLETLRHRALEQLGRVYGHLESVLDEVRSGIDRVEEEQEDQDEATAAAAARLGVEPPASSPEESPRFPDLRPHEPAGDSDLGDGGDGMLSATRPSSPDLPEAEATDRVEATDRAEAPDRPGQPALSDAVSGTEASEDGTEGSAVGGGSGNGVEGSERTAAGSGDRDTKQPTLTADSAEIGDSAETTQPGPADDPNATTQPTSPAQGAAAANGEGGSSSQEATQRLEPVGNSGAKSRSSKQGKGRP